MAISAPGRALDVLRLLADGFGNAALRRLTAVRPSQSSDTFGYPKTGRSTPQYRRSSRCRLGEAVLPSRMSTDVRTGGAVARWRLM